MVSTSPKVSEYQGQERERRGGNCKHPFPLSLLWPVEALPVWTKAWPGHRSSQKQRQMNRARTQVSSATSHCLTAVLLCQCWTQSRYHPGEPLHDSFNNSSLSQSLEPRWGTQSLRADVSPLWLRSRSQPCEKQSSGPLCEDGQPLLSLALF